MTKEQAIEFLMKDGDLKVPCSRYGRNTSDCAEVAWAAYVISCNETGEGFGRLAELDYMMGLVVNDHDDIEYLLFHYGTEYGFNYIELIS